MVFLDYYWEIYILLFLSAIIEIMEDNFIEDFTTDLFTKAGFEPKEFDELREELEPVLWDYILNKLIEKMNPKQQNEADMLLDNDDGE